MKTLVTGAAGFIGSHICEALLLRGDDVVGVDAFMPYYSRAMKEANLAAVRTAGVSFEFVEADLRCDDVASLLSGCDAVVHQAAQPGVRLSWSDGFVEYVQHNVLATQRLLEAAKNTNISKFVYASSSSVYGNQTRYPVIESDVPVPHSPYGVTKLAAEHLCALYASNYGVPTVALRYFTVFGPRQRPDMSMHRLCDAALNGATFPRFGDGKQIREFTFVGDVVAANLAASTADLAPGTFMNIAGGGEISLNELIVMIADLGGQEIAVETHPAQPGDSLRNGGSTDRAHELLGWEPRVSLHDGLRAQLDWHASMSRTS